MYITWVTGAATLSATASQAPPNNLTSQVRLCLAYSSFAVTMPKEPVPSLDVEGQ